MHDALSGSQSSSEPFLPASRVRTTFNDLGPTRRVRRAAVVAKFDRELASHRDGVRSRDDRARTVRSVSDNITPLTLIVSPSSVAYAAAGTEHPAPSSRKNERSATSDENAAPSLMSASTDVVTSSSLRTSSAIEP